MAADVPGATGDVPGATGDVPGASGATGDVPGASGATGDVPGASGATGDAACGSREVALLVRVQSALTGRPGAIAAARGLSHFGEHALGWVAVAGLGAALDKPRRREWAGVAVGAVGAHAASIVIKRIVRRPRPNDPLIEVNVSTPSQLSFPSSHATSTTAAAILLARVTGLPLVPLLVPPMLLSRLVLGVHYPSDVLAGAAVGCVSAAVVLRTQDKLDQKKSGVK